MRDSKAIGFARIGNRSVFAESQIEAYQRRLLGKEPLLDSGTGNVKRKTR